MKKVFYFLLSCIFLFQPASASVNDKELHLVVGNNREQGIVFGYLKRINGEGTDFTHTKTFGGKAVSLDITPTTRSDLPHIQADARTFKPNPGQVIKNVFMELFPSTVHGIEGVPPAGVAVEVSNDDPIESFQELAYMAFAIDNLSQFMPTGASLLIEHSPSLDLSPELFLYQSITRLIRKENPFCCSDSIYFMDFLKSAYLMPIDRQIFWNKRFKDMEDRSENTVYIRYYADDMNKHSQRIIVIMALIDIARSLNKTIENLISLIDAEHAKYQLDRPMIYLKDNLRDSLSYPLLCWYSIYSQAPLIANFLQEKGFGNVKIQTGDNPLNGRRNCWMISAQKEK